ncbi:phosphate ABC transporter substrate-binding protein [Fervidicella metallireducens AeB]|uniref:Phosphate-binding protein n=1 Tax=Fervidicella metallireducens AeB TaxID=1403537 RepID=A0A017RYX3_9CLOT|nr:phosphate ABC transporter substrate-binding protein [Fervidicella metallireducens]EYE89120.1 phosphate ABC transporter substrate-binding protein [Fervidicella metallireducens AeB]
MKKIRNVLVMFICAIVCLATTVSYASSKKTLAGTIKCSGSTALLPIVKQAAEDFMKVYPKVSIEVTGGGSGTGIRNVTDGVVDIGNSDVFAPENSGLVDNQIAVIPFLFIANNDVKVSSLTNDQLKGIFSGKITNWKEVGGEDKKIVVVMRPASSGTRMTIQQIVMGKENFTTNAIVQDSTGSVKTTVANTPGAIGYIDLAYVDSKVKALKYNNVECNLENVKNGKYTLVSIGHMYTKGQPNELTKAFIEYIKGTTFQNRVLQYYKFAPVTKELKDKVNKIKIGSSSSNNKNTIKPSVKRKK